MGSPTSGAGWFVMRRGCFFGSKPNEETRAALKSNGFRWSPKNQAWQRQLTRNAEDAALMPGKPFMVLCLR